jgi:hypothetical protein
MLFCCPLGFLLNAPGGFDDRFDDEGRLLDKGIF